MDYSDSLGLIPYNFEPQLSEEELVLLSNVDNMTVEETIPYSAVEDWCSCNNCEEMKSDECVCCKTSDLTVGNLDDNECITEHTHFEQIVLNPVILEVAFIQIMAFKGQTGRAPDNLSNRYICLFLSSITSNLVGDSGRVALSKYYLTF